MYIFKVYLIILPVTYGRKVRMTSSPHGPYELGYTHATMAMTVRSDGASRSNSINVALVRIVGCNSPT